MSVMDFTDLIYVDVDISRTSTFRAKALRQEVVVNGSLRNVYLIIFIAMIQKGVIWQLKAYWRVTCQSSITFSFIP
jgi:hypothetical protein